VSRRAAGFQGARPRDWLLALLHPLLVIGLIGAIAFAAGAVETTRIDWLAGWRRAAIAAASTFVAVILTEEGFFRGWLWGSLDRAGVGPTRALLGSSLAFSLWHLSWVTLDRGAHLPLPQVPIFLANAALLGLALGLLRWISGSVLVSSLSHGLWNGLVYVWFGASGKVGALGITNTLLFGPEVGLLGLIANLTFGAALWRWWGPVPDRA